jgi:drug/metabolite transporter (DMT)-like permease
VAVSIRLIGKREAAITIAMWFHTCTIAWASLPLLLGWPEPLQTPSLPEAALLLGVAVTSFTYQLLMTRGLQLLPAAQASAVGFLQVGYLSVTEGSLWSVMTHRVWPGP